MSIKQHTKESAEFEITRLKHLKKEVDKLSIKTTTVKDIMKSIDSEIEFYKKLIKDSNGN